MAEIVLGMCLPHSGILGRPAETWVDDGERDKAKPELWYRQKTWTYDELLEERKNQGFAGLMTLEQRQARYQRCNKALDKMSRIYEEANIDVAIIIGKDQKEIFVDHSPTIAIYTGKEIYNGKPQKPVWGPDEFVTHEGHPELAMHLTKSLQAEGFDLTDLFNWPGNQWVGGEPIVPHAFGFVYHRIMHNRVTPNVPIMMNTFYPPTQPSMSRSIAFGEHLLKAVRAWDSDKRVALIASGGLTHFVCDEDFDQKIIKMMGDYDLEGLAAVDDRWYQSGTSEIKLFASVLVAMKDTGARMNLIDYVPCYRTEAGTGEGMGFMSWSP